jgi:PhoH-like ATPase
MRTFVLDTSVLLSNPKSMYGFQEHEVVLPLVVVKELESKRNDPELGWAARSALRELEALRNKSGSELGDLQRGIVINDMGGSLRVETNHSDRSHLPSVLKNDPSHDTRILTVAAALSSEGKNVTLISKDLPMRLLASAVLGISASDYTNNQMPDSGYTGIVKIDAYEDVVGRLYNKHVVEVSSLSESLQEEINSQPINTCFIITENGSHALARHTTGGKLQLVNGEIQAFGAKGRSAEQRFALAHLLDNNIGIVSLGGPGGTGKSLLALAAALESVIERRTHNKIMVFRPLYAVGGQDLGYLPGTQEEKFSPWAAATFDALGAFCSKNAMEEVIERDIIEVLPLTHIRGRTFNDTIVIIDEAQNLEWNVLLTALSRSGENTRVFLTHDVAQRDNLHVGRHDGIAAVVERLKGESLFAHVSLHKSERSQIAALVTRIMDQQ